MSSPRADAPAAPKRERLNALTLCLVALAAAFLVGLLLLPRQAIPDAVPLPVADTAALARTFEADVALAEQAKRALLPGNVRALGSALRDLHRLEARDGDAGEIGKARQAVDTALMDAQSLGPGPLLELRALHLQTFLAEVAVFAGTGVESEELTAVAGGFVRSMRAEGLCEGHRLAVSGAPLRAMFKQMWASVLSLDARAPFALTLDEQRAVYALRLSLFPLPAKVRNGIAQAKSSAKSPRECEAAKEMERSAIERSSLDHITRFSAVDPLYPGAYARGIALFRGGHFAAAADAFGGWLHAHPDGPLTLRARSYLRSAARSAQVE